MLTQIKKIKSLGVFDNYAAPPEAKAFERFNVVYGENGSGKTTLSRLLACLQSGEHKDYPHLEFNVDTQSGPLSHGQKYVRNVRVFNSDFVEANIGRFDGPLRHILILGEENKAVAEEIKAEIATRDDRTKRLQDIAAAVTKLENERGKAMARSWAVTTFQTSPGKSSKPSSTFTFRPKTSSIGSSRTPTSTPTRRRRSTSLPMTCRTSRGRASIRPWWPRPRRTRPTFWR